MAEICGAKRPAEQEEQEGAKRVKGEEQKQEGGDGSILTGLSDQEIKERIGEEIPEPKDEDLGEVVTTPAASTPGLTPALGG